MQPLGWLVCLFTDYRAFGLQRRSGSALDGGEGARQGIRHGQVDRSLYTYNTHARCDRAEASQAMQASTGHLFRTSRRLYRARPVRLVLSSRARDMNFCLDNCAPLYVADPLNDPLFMFYHASFAHAAAWARRRNSKGRRELRWPPFARARRGMGPRSGGTYQGWA